ncbi:MAG: GNAT family N-acetyltransferase [Proteobacteria bacterium]|nr:GNAT family N-acetyltransferase [Pseudomonadota bacterium]MBU1713986.1 GNAT family N-acetyltransferase [Pseudomonadota bacterium]
MNVVGEITHYLGDDYAFIKFSESLHAFSIDMIMVPADYRKQGIGTMLIKHILILADQFDKEINVSARPIGPCTDEKIEALVTYYEKFGFQVIDRGLTVAYMKRKSFRSAAGE